MSYQVSVAKSESNYVLHFLEQAKKEGYNNRERNKIEEIVKNQSFMKNPTGHLNRMKAKFNNECVEDETLVAAYRFVCANRHLWCPLQQSDR